jgi:hypothetical protein
MTRTFFGPRTHFFFLLLAFLVAQAPAAGQSGDVLGPHNVNGRGCQSCHTPHHGAAGEGPGGDPATGGESLWGRSFHAATYATFGGSALTITSTYAASDPIFHTAACLSCHDGAVAVAGMTGQSFETVNGTRVPTYMAADGQSLSNDHPVHVPYTCGEEHWPCTIDASGKVIFSSGDAGTVHFTNTYGRPARFFPGSAGMVGVAYVECSTCHNPHALNFARYTIGGVKVVKPTRFFVRGWYDSENPASNSALQFCRSCHYAQSNEYADVASPAN